MNKKLKFFIIAFAWIISFSLLLLINFYLNYNPIETRKENVNNITLFVDYNNGTIKVRENFTLDNWKTTAFDALDKWCDIKYVDHGWGIFVEEIDGIRGGWIYLINNYAPNVGAPVYQLNDGDEVKWLIK
ncbi:MAG: DUF4430 domain-containing protein [Candidatus Hodarchaeota archaeon]